MFISKHKKGIRICCWTLFLLYLIALIYVLFLAEMLGRTHVERGYHYNLILFKEIGRFIVYRKQLGFQAVFLNLAGNILIFAPFGFLVPTMTRKLRNCFRVMLLSFELSFMVEFVQLVTRTGSFDVDDLLLNTIGGILGFLIYAILQHRRDVEADRVRNALREQKKRDMEAMQKNE